MQNSPAGLNKAPLYKRHLHSCSHLITFPRACHCIAWAFPLGLSQPRLLKVFDSRPQSRRRTGLGDRDSFLCPVARAYFHHCRADDNIAVCLIDCLGDNCKWTRQFPFKQGTEWAVFLCVGQTGAGDVTVFAGLISSLGRTR